MVHNFVGDFDRDFLFQARMKLLEVTIVLILIIIVVKHNIVNMCFH